MLEVRSTGELRSNGKTLTGYAAIFNSEAVLGDFVEVIRNGAFRNSLQSGTNIRALYHHQGDALLGTTRGGTLQLREDTKGLAFELALPDTTHGRDLAILVDRGDVAGCSFGFRVRDGGDRWEQRGAQLVRELLDVDLVEITLTADPAYADTTVALRSRQAIRSNDTRALWLETCVWD
ncbi:HK97 family phage prohead protease [Ottowia sp. SB7-C50]|uniref:HK97 family phage prohead protease n=1 Tax=Ottowia sp. SB7-C50 TaxID=3081231 RepID=UPI0029537BD1|nr:HK97 family phage prohead protease [Ottowia sp. SB7-C50]WOP14515.1 HK97 family phage prohead protease [Ottowia sp. SB7-C50]WOP15932.1 HK97 family phage prohead protease [Ottowia sp. SB7-C50]